MRIAEVAGAVLLTIVAAGCDPIINVFGSFFPAWVICIAAGVVVALLLRPVFAATGLEPHLGPLVLVYPSLAVLATMVAWLVFFST